MEWSTGAAAADSKGESIQDNKWKPSDQRTKGGAKQIRMKMERV